MIISVIITDKNGNPALKLENYPLDSERVEVSVINENNIGDPVVVSKEELRSALVRTVY